MVTPAPLHPRQRILRRQSVGQCKVKGWETCVRKLVLEHSSYPAWMRCSQAMQGIFVLA